MCANSYMVLQFYSLLPSTQCSLVLYATVDWLVCILQMSAGEACFSRQIRDSNHYSPSFGNLNFKIWINSVEGRVRRKFANYSFEICV